MANYIIREKDALGFENKIQPLLNKDIPQYIYSSFTYITPNYSILLYLQELYKIIKKHNLKVIIVIWDMSTLANSYYKGMPKSMSDKEFIKEKVREIYDICYSLGFQKDGVSVYTSSSLWKRLVTYKGHDIFQEFYSTLSRLRIEKYALSYKAAYFIQLPINLFFCDYFHLLFPEDVSQKIKLAFIEGRRETLYAHARRIMHNIRGNIYEFPLFFIMKDFPYFNYNEYEPEWNMNSIDIQELISNIKPNKSDVVKVSKLLGIKDLSISKNEPESYMELSNNIYKYLQGRKDEYEKVVGTSRDTILSITNREDMINIGGVIRSKISLGILLEANGEKTISEISKKLGKSIPTISSYVKRLKELKIVEVDINGKLRRLIKGITANFELGI